MPRERTPTPRGNDRVHIEYEDELRVLSSPDHVPCVAGRRLFVQRVNVKQERPVVTRCAVSPETFQNELIAQGLMLYHPSYDAGWIRIEKDPNPSRRLRVA
jgi:hypothetical protein